MFQSTKLWFIFCSHTIVQVLTEDIMANYYPLKSVQLNLCCKITVPSLGITFQIKRNVMKTWSMDHGHLIPMSFWTKPLTVAAQNVGYREMVL